MKHFFRIERRMILRIYENCKYQLKIYKNYDYNIFLQCIKKLNHYDWSYFVRDHKLLHCVYKNAFTFLINYFFIVYNLFFNIFHTFFFFFCKLLAKIKFFKRKFQIFVVNFISERKNLKYTYAQLLKGFSLFGVNNINDETLFL